MKKTKFYVYSDVSIEPSFKKNISEFGTFNSFDSAKREAIQTNYWLGYAGPYGSTESCTVIEFSPFKPKTKAELLAIKNRPKTILRKSK